MPADAEALVGRVLLVEDDRADRLIFRHMLENLGIDHNEIVIVETAAHALSEALRDAPDFVVCDWLLGDGTARSLLRDLRSVCPHAATVVITGDVNETREALALEAGAQEVLAKSETSPERLHKALRQSKERLAAANRERDLAVRVASANRLEQMGTMAAGVIHDLNNLMSSASMNLELVRDEELRAATGVTTDNALRDVGVAIDRATRLCRQLLAYGKHSQREPTAQRLLELTEGCVNILPRRTRALVVIDEDADEAPPLAVVDPSSFEQVAYNLLLNAGDAVGEGGRVNVSVSLGEAKDFDQNHVVVPRPPGTTMVMLAVRDDGPGIDNAQLRKVFRPFFSTKRGSRGLGLPSVVRAVRMSKGALSVKTGPEGTTFFVGFPVDPSHDAATVPTAGQLQGATVTYGPVLVVDDRAPSPVVTRLRDEGHEVEWCRSDVGCMHLIEDMKGRVSVVVLHVIRSAHDTVELAGDIWSACPDVPVVILDDRPELDASIDTALHAAVAHDLGELSGVIGMLVPFHALH